MAYRKEGRGYPKHLFVPYNGKIADITHADTNKHTLDLAAALIETRKIIGFVGVEQRMGGTGEFRYYPNEGVTGFGYVYTRSANMIIIANGTQRLQYSLTVAGDDFDLYCMGYVVEV